jgi:hypothetical protein
MRRKIKTLIPSNGEIHVRVELYRRKDDSMGTKVWRSPVKGIALVRSYSIEDDRWMDAIDWIVSKPGKPKRLVLMSELSRSSKFIETYDTIAESGNVDEVIANVIANVIRRHRVDSELIPEPEPEPEPINGIAKRIRMRGEG